MNSSSSAISRLCASASELVVTDMPLCAGVVQAGSRRPTPATSTRHIRQEPGELRPSRWQSEGIVRPFACATWKMVWPSVAVYSSLSIRTEICGTAVAPIRAGTACATVSRMSQRRQRHASSRASSGRSAETASSNVFARTAGGRKCAWWRAHGLGCGGVWSYWKVGHDAVRSAVRRSDGGRCSCAASLPYAMAVTTFDAPVTKSPPA